MGLAASQARLLTITARLADNELRSQTINNAKMRLAAQSAQASDAYVSALNNAQLMFTNTNENGLSQTQALTFNSLTQYSQYNNQYGLVNSSGQTLVSEKDAKIFEANNTNLEGFLKAHGLEWETTYFDETSGDLVNKLRSFYTGDYQYIGDLFSGLNNASLKNLYLDSISEEASIENVNYANAARNYYNMLTSLKTEVYPDLRTEIFGSSTAGIDETVLINEFGNLGSADDVKKELLEGNKHTTIIDDSIDGGAKFALNYLETGFGTNIIAEGARTRLRNIIGSLVDFNGKSGYATKTVTPIKTDNSGEYYDNSGNLQNYSDIKYEFSFSYNAKDSSSNPETKNVKFTIVYKDILQPTGNTCAGGQCQEISSREAYIYATTTDGEGNPKICDFKFNGQAMDSESNAKNTSKNINGVNVIGNLSTLGKELNLNDPNDIDLVLNNVLKTTISFKTGNTDTILHYYNGQVGFVPLFNNKVDAYKAVAEQYLNAIFNSPDTFDAFAYLSTKSESDPLVIKYGNCAANYGIYNIGISYPDDTKLLLDFDELIKTKGITLSGSNIYMKSVIGAYMVEKMVDVLGEPKYGWVDKSNNPTGNPDSKAQWLTNLFNRMQKGYKVLENGLASSKEWLEYAFESGLVTMEQVDMSYNWVGLDYKSCASINEDTDNSALVAKAEAEYNRAMNDIKQKDSLYDLQLKNIDTEHNSLQTEYDVIKDVIKKNIERTMKFDQSA